MYINMQKYFQILAFVIIFPQSQQLSLLRKLFQSQNNSITTSPTFVYKSYQTGMYCTPFTDIQTPSTIQKVQLIVQEAITSGQTVKAIGSLHSVTDVICTDGIPISMHKINYAIVDKDGTATFGAGIQLFDALQFLEERNKTLIHVPSYGGITIGGALGTGAHGSTLVHPSTISDQVESITIVDGLGNIQIINEIHKLKAFRVNLGLLGVVIDVTRRTTPLFKMHVENMLEDESILFDGTALSWARQYDWFQVWWFPSFQEVVVSKGNYTRTSVPGNAVTNLIPDQNPLSAGAISTAFELLQLTRSKPLETVFEEITKLSLYTTVVGKPPIFSEDGVTLSNPAVGYVWRLQSNKCTHCAWDRDSVVVGGPILPEDFSMAFDVSNFSAVFAMMKNILAQHPATFHMIGVFIRFSKASDSLMGMSSGRDTFNVEWVTPMRTDRYNTPRLGIGAYQAIQQEMIQNYNGRPHWGKNGAHFTTQSVLKSSAPNRAAFVVAMKMFDPKGLFLNKFGKRILSVSNSRDMDPEVTRCALQDYCVCKTESDCGTLQNCVQLNGFNVCKDVISINIPTLHFGNLENLTHTNILEVNGVISIG